MPLNQRHTLKAFNGNRVKNLLALADAIRAIARKSFPTPEQLHTLEGYSEQLRIIADEWPRACPHSTFPGCKAKGGEA